MDHPLIESVPPQLTLALVQLAPSLSSLKQLAQLASWTGSWYDSFLCLAAWWFVCLSLYPLLRYFLPLVLALALFFLSPYSPHQNHLVTESTLLSAVADLSAIHVLLPSRPQLPPIPLPILVRASLILYPPYLFLTSFVSIRVLIALSGSLLLTWRAPWAIVIRTLLWRSASFRWLLYRSAAFVTGRPLPPPTVSFQPTATSATPVNSLRFLFTIYENQRWWMGLDWTAALLPNERPSWSTASYYPVSPPNAFSLPDNTTLYLPDGSGRRIKRTAVWRWEEPEWRVLVRKEGSTLSRLERPLPTIKDENPNASRLLKAAGRLREASSSEKPPLPHPEHPTISEEPESLTDDDPATDIDGWVYGDNKWEAQSSRGGMGKYTRYRRWTRVAVVSETVRVVDDDDDGNGQLGIIRTPSQHPSDPSPLRISTTSSDAPVSDIPSPDASSDSPLRQRLKMALTKAPGPPPTP
ncbi:integral peroxisomal membrane peroxin-domain-containing protein [Cyathus striatus]|nr:integral peroxisomal membrane peroxin-domain-containing protein [Cyathus striatus]